MQIRISIADDHPMIIDGLEHMVRNYAHLTLMGVYPDGRSLLTGLEGATPDVLLLDIQLPDHNGDYLAPLILKKYPDIRILILTNIDSTLSLYIMLRLGVKGYALKTMDQKTLIQAIETVYRGEEFMEPSLRERLQQFTLRVKKGATVKPTLTPREKEILQHIIDGHTSQEIADILCIGFRTVEHYRENILLKLDTKNTAQLVKKALMLGLAE